MRKYSRDKKGLKKDKKKYKKLSIHENKKKANFLLTLCNNRANSLKRFDLHFATLG